MRPVEGSGGVLGCGSLHPYRSIPGASICNDSLAVRPAPWVRIGGIEIIEASVVALREKVGKQVAKAQGGVVGR